MSEKKQITVCICYDGDEEKLNKTLIKNGGRKESGIDVS